MKSDNAKFKMENPPFGPAGGLPASVSVFVRFILLFALSFLPPVTAPAATNSPPCYDAQVSVAFGSRCKSLLLSSMAQAKTEVCIAIYTLTDKGIYTAIADAAARGVTVRVKYDKASSEFPAMKLAIGYLKGKGVNCRAISMKGDAKMHDKFTVIDGDVVLTGSYNYTALATYENHENLVLIASREVAARYLAEFKNIR
jgi:phosphatidylserine/phosphatidylglycerophosphate/cardiolipin synthase-like enzyme